MVFTKKGDFQLAVNILLKAFPETGEHESCGYKKYWQLLKLHYKALFMKKGFPIGINISFEAFPKNMAILVKLVLESKDFKFYW